MSTKKHANRRNISGEWFGSLYALRDIGLSARQPGSRLWYCMCACGQSRHVSTKDLVGNRVLECCACATVEQSKRSSKYYSTAIDDSHKLPSARKTFHGASGDPWSAVSGCNTVCLKAGICD